MAVFANTQSEFGIHQGRFAAAECGWPTRTAQGPDGPYATEPDSQFVMVLGTRRIGLVDGYCRGGDLVLVSQDIDLTHLSALYFRPDFTQCGANAESLRWILQVRVDGEVRASFKPALDGRNFSRRRGFDVTQDVGVKTVALALVLGG